MGASVTPVSFRSDHVARQPSAPHADGRLGKTGRQRHVVNLSSASFPLAVGRPDGPGAQGTPDAA
jgi:hypothetical protein